MTSNEIWTNSKRQRDTLRLMFEGRCAYCGKAMDKMQADHVLPVFRVMNGLDGRPLPASEQRMLRPERNVVANMLPACAPCNLHKAGYKLEEWRNLLQRTADILAREKSIFRAAVRFGVITVSDNPIVFHFESINP